MRKILKIRTLISVDSGCLLTDQSNGVQNANVKMNIGLENICYVLFKRTGLRSIKAFIHMMAAIV